MSIGVFSREWIFRYGYYHGHIMDTSTREPITLVNLTLVDLALVNLT